ncbi:ankyrin repeat-containing domain protein [Obelidium mucronatum]|nr:ankyrin repeat-containing domain protein [Obelidium mucronatum]
MLRFKVLADSNLWSRCGGCFCSQQRLYQDRRISLKDPSVDPSALSSQALCCACMEGHEDIVRLLLLDSRVNPAAMRNTPFKLASMRGNEKIMKLLLSTGKVAGFTGFVNVCKYGLIGILQHLLEELQACSPVDKRRHVKILWEGVTSAYMNGHPDVMFAVMGFLDLWGQCQDYQLHASVRGYHESDTYIILSADWKEDYKLFANRVFHVAVGVGDSTHIEKFLHHTEIDPSLGNHFAFRRAVERGHINAVRLLLDKWNADPTADDNFPIRVAAQNGHIEIVKILLATGKVDVLAESSYAIRMAKKMGHKGIVSLLEDWVKDI